MQELRIVLIIVGLLAIAALLFHGLWTNRKDSKASKFSNKPLGKLGGQPFPERSSVSAEENNEDTDYRNDRHESVFVDDEAGDPLLGGFDIVQDDEPSEPDGFEAEQNIKAEYLAKTIDQVESENDVEAGYPADEAASVVREPVRFESDASTNESDEDFEVIVLSVHCAGNQPFIGTQLFESMKQNGLLYGPMEIFHRHADLSGTGKVLFSVANIMQPGTLRYDDPEAFTTKGISFFMTLPGFGDPEQNFKLMLKTAQQIADDLGGNVVDEKRNLMTPDRISDYRRQIQQFKARNA